MVNYILRSWHANKMGNSEDEANRIIFIAAKIIKAEMRITTYDLNNYPCENDIKSSARGLCFLPSSLRLLLKAIIPNQVKVVSIGQCIVSAAKPRSSLPAVLFGLGVEVDEEIGSRWIIEERYRFGFSVSYDEVKRFKQSVVLDEKVDDVITTSFPGHFAQWVGGGGGGVT